MKSNIGVLLFWVAFMTLPIFLQVIICKKTTSKVGLILPIVSFVISLIFVLNLRNGTDDFAFRAIIVLLLLNIPTSILYGIYHAHKKKNKMEWELDKMKLKDL